MSSLKGETLASGHTVEYLSDEERIAYEKIFLGTDNVKKIRLIPGGFFMPEGFMKFANKYYTFPFQPSDVLVMTFPKSGSTWMQEIIWNMLRNPNMDNPEVVNGINIRVPYFELDSLLENRDVPIIEERHDMLLRFAKMCPIEARKEGIYLYLSKLIPEPRIFKSHIPLSLLNPKLLDTCKVVFVSRNPKDVCISLHHQVRLTKLSNYVGSIDEFIEAFMQNYVYYCPYWLTTKEAWERRDHPNMLFLYYEDMKADIMKEIKKIDKFLQTNLSEDQLRTISNYASFEEMKKRNNILTVNDTGTEVFHAKYVEEHGGFFRKGIVGDGKNSFTKEQSNLLDEWISKNSNDMPGFKYATA